MNVQHVIERLSSFRVRLVSQSTFSDEDFAAIAEAIRLLGSEQPAESIMPPSRRRRRAVVIGTNYPGDAAALRGCAIDADLWSMLLSQRRYESHKLVDHQAERAVLLAALEDLARTPNADLVVCFSGHGTQVPNRDRDESDRRDKAICPTDFRRDGVITDDRLAACFDGLPDSSRLLVILDCCHSGTGTRSEVASRSVAWDDSIPRDAYRRDQQTGRRPNVATLAACRDDETAGDTPNGGLFSYSLVSALPRALAISTTTAEWLTMAWSQVAKMSRNRQTPQYDGPSWPLKEFFE